MPLLLKSTPPGKSRRRATENRDAARTGLAHSIRPVGLVFTLPYSDFHEAQEIKHVTGGKERGLLFPESRHLNAAPK